MLAGQYSALIFVVILDGLDEQEIELVSQRDCRPQKESFNSS